MLSTLMTWEFTLGSQLYYKTWLHLCQQSRNRYLIIQQWSAKGSAKGRGPILVILWKDTSVLVHGVRDKVWPQVISSSDLGDPDSTVHGMTTCHCMHVLTLLRQHVKVRQWPARSSDIFSTKHVWDQLGHQLRSSANLQNLVCRFKQLWVNVLHERRHVNRFGVVPHTNDLGPAVLCTINSVAILSDIDLTLQYSHMTFQHIHVHFISITLHVCLPFLLLSI